MEGRLTRGLFPPGRLCVVSRTWICLRTLPAVLPGLDGPDKGFFLPDAFMGKESRAEEYARSGGGRVRAVEVVRIRSSKI